MCLPYSILNEVILLLLNSFLIFQNELFEPFVVLWYIAISFLFITSGIFIIKALKLEIKSQKNVYTGYGLFSFFFGLTRLFFLLSGFCSTLECNLLFIMLGYLMGTFGIIIIIFILETYLLNTKKILTGITSILFGIILIAIASLARELALMMIYILRDYFHSLI